MGDFWTAIDQMRREVSFSFPPERIISLVPSQTEYLVDLGANVVGRTKFCIHPADAVKEIDVVGGTKNFRFEKIKELQPDLIIGNKEENYQEGIDRLSRDYPVWMSDVRNLEDAFWMMEQLSRIVGREAQAAPILAESKHAMNKVQGTRKGKAIYLIWKKPWMAAGKGTFIDAMLTHLGYENVIKSDRYPELSEEQIERLEPQVLLFSSEPYPFKEEDIRLANTQWPSANAELVDGELFSWYGSRMCRWTDQ